MVGRADVILLEMHLRQLARGQGISITLLNGKHNTDYENPVQFKIGSNGFFLERDNLADLMPLLDPELDSYWLDEYLRPFLEQYAG